MEEQPIEPFGAATRGAGAIDRVAGHGVADGVEMDPDLVGPPGDQVELVGEAPLLVDVRREETAIHEANLLGLPVLALVDTNCDPSGVDYVIPSNDDAIRAIKLLTAKVADAVLEGKALRKDLPEEERDELPAARRVAAVEAVEFADEDLLGEATLAKLQSGDYDEELRAALAEGGVPAETLEPQAPPAADQPAEDKPTEVAAE